MQTSTGTETTQLTSESTTKKKRGMQWYLEHCPGVAGELARYINGRLDTQQPGIALATAIAFMGAIRSERVKSLTGISTNIYTCAIAPSGVGKSRAQQCIMDICDKAGISDILMGRPGSDAGILKRLQKTNRQFLIWDEFGLAFSEMSQSKNSYRVSIISTIMDLYSSAGRMCLGRELKGEDRQDVKNPFLSICAASTPNRFYQALNRDFIEDGFLGRWLIFDTENAINFKDSTYSSIPSELVHNVRILNAGVTRHIGADLEMALRPECNILTIDDAIIDSIKISAENKIMGSRTEIERIFWSRAYENTLKLCMIFSSFDCECKDIDAVYAWSLTCHLIEELLARCTTDLHDTQSDKVQVQRTRKFNDLIPPGSEMTQAQLTRKCQAMGLNRQERLARTNEMIDAEIWRKTERYITESSLRPTTFYICAK